MTKAKKKWLPKLPCPDTPENRQALIQQMLDLATYRRSLTHPEKTEVFSYLLVIAPDGTLNHVSASECRGDIFVIAEYARGNVTMIEKIHGQVRWVLPPVQTRRY